MIKFFRHIRFLFAIKNKAFCHSALDAESAMKLKWISFAEPKGLSAFAGMTIKFKL